MEIFSEVTPDNESSRSSVKLDRLRCFDPSTELRENWRLRCFDFSGFGDDCGLRLGELNSSSGPSTELILRAECGLLEMAMEMLDESLRPRTDSIFLLPRELGRLDVASRGSSGIEERARVSEMAPRPLNRGGRDVPASDLLNWSAMWPSPSRVKEKLRRLQISVRGNVQYPAENRPNELRGPFAAAWRTSAIGAHNGQRHGDLVRRLGSSGRAGSAHKEATRTSRRVHVRDGHAVK